MTLCVVHEVDAKRAYADELQQELTNVPDHGANTKRRVELGARHVQIREALELRFYFGEPVRDLGVLVNGRQEASFLALEVANLFQQIADGVIARELGFERCALLLQAFDLQSKSPVLDDELLGQRGPAPEECLQEGVPLLLEVAGGLLDWFASFGRLATAGRATLLPGHRF